jgi:hypothetical protein
MVALLVSGVFTERVLMCDARMRGRTLLPEGAQAERHRHRGNRLQRHPKQHESNDVSVSQR